MSDMKSFINKVADGASLSADQSAQAFELMMSGDASEGQIAGFLMALRVRGETIEEITGAATTMRAKATPVSAPAGSVDVCGTGGDAKGTYNISTCVSFVLAACGVPVAKHGNRSISSKSGAADVLEALGVNLAVTPEQVSACIEMAGVGFMFAQNHHSAMKHVMPARLALGTRTIFNLLGPLTNPAGAKAQLLGVFSDHWVEPLAHVLKNLGATSAWVVHGSDGLDELTTTGPNFVAQLKNGEISTFTITPVDAGLSTAAADDLLGGDARENADAILDVLSGKASAFRDIVLLNTGAALVVAGKAPTIKEGVQLAASSIDNGAAKTALNQLIATSNGS